MHRNAPLPPEGRLRLCNLIEDGWPVAAAAESMRISRQTAHKWWRRYQDAGIAGLEDRSSGPRRCPTKTSARMERRIVELRRHHQLGPARLAPRVGMPASTFHRVLRRHGVSRLSDLDRKGGRVIRRIETTHPGELVHVDVKKQAKIPKGGGWRVNGLKDRSKNGQAGRPRLGYAFIHSAIDAHSRLAYSEIHADERATTVIGFWRRARAFFASYGITVERVLSDNGSLLPGQSLHRRAHCRGHQPHVHQALPTPDQWQGRTLQPDPAERVGLRPPLWLRGRQNTGPGHLAPHTASLLRCRWADAVHRTGGVIGDVEVTIGAWDGINRAAPPRPVRNSESR